jgi:penicillin-insensitive murein endopeptidase
MVSLDRISGLLIPSLLVGGLAVGTLPIPTAQADPARKLPARFARSPYSLMSLSVGYPNDGWQLRAKQLRPSEALRIKRNSAEHSYGHPALILMLQRSAGEIAEAYPGSVMVVGDVAAKAGGPLQGHRSHQSGRDADVGFYARDWRGRPFTPERFVSYGADGKAKNYPGLYFDDERNWALVVSWLRDNRAGVTHVFVSRDLRERLLAHGRKSAQRTLVGRIGNLLRQPKSVSAHDDHFHVRIACPARQEAICQPGVK